jgi:hypothetical protein
MLLKIPTINVNMGDDHDGITPLIAAAKGLGQQRINIVKLLVSFPG